MSCNRVIDKEVLDASSKVQETVTENPLALGLAVIVGNQESEWLPLKDPLVGPIKDVDSMNKAFRSLHYATLPVTNASRNAILGLVHGIKKYFPRSPTAGCYRRIVFAFAGHGDNTDSLHTKDGKVCLRSEIIFPLMPCECKVLDKIPKLFFIDACRNKVDTPVRRGGDSSSVPDMANYYLVQSTQPQQQAMEDSSGGYWMQLFATELSNHENNVRKNVQSLIIKVNNLIREKMSKTDTFLQQPVDGSTLHDDILFIDEAMEFKEKVLSKSACSLSVPSSSSCQGASSSGVAIVPGLKCSANLQSYEKVPLCPDEELKKMLAEKCGKEVKIEYKTKTVKGGYKTTVMAPCIGYAEGRVCTSRKDAEKSAASEALQMLESA